MRGCPLATTTRIVPGAAEDSATARNLSLAHQASSLAEHCQCHNLCGLLHRFECNRPHRPIVASRPPIGGSATTAQTARPADGDLVDAGRRSPLRPKEEGVMATSRTVEPLRIRDAIALPAANTTVTARAQRSDRYTVHVVAGMRELHERLGELLDGVSVAVITDETVRELYGAH